MGRTIKAGYNVITGADSERIADAVRHFDPGHEPEQYYGEGHAAEIIAGKIVEYLEDKKIRR
ncbi:MAG: hypothetical protein U5N56_00620 [Candidatus Marinimicrobia bacterium]|nr:hypothetical protein [Candidatus Neomarinimicrobiota bacterium]